jgi:hypothetical protein
MDAVVMVECTCVLASEKLKQLRICDGGQVEVALFVQRLDMKLDAVVAASHATKTKAVRLERDYIFQSMYLTGTVK